MEVTGNSISVTKRCVPLEECLSTGCRDSENEGYKVWGNINYSSFTGFSRAHEQISPTHPYIGCENVLVFLFALEEYQPVAGQRTSRQGV